MASSSSSNIEPRDDHFDSKANPPREIILTGRKFPCFIDLMTNDTDTFLSVSRILLRFANNILRDPNNLRYRYIKLCNEIFMTKLLPVHGAVDCLFSMGFQEADNDRLFLDPATALGDLVAIRGALLDESAVRYRMESSKGSNVPLNEESGNSKVEHPDGEISNEKIGQEKVVQGDELKLKFTPQQKVAASRKVLRYVPVLDTQGKQQFYEKVTSPIDQIFLYENKELQNLARDVIPIEKLEQQAKINCNKDDNNSNESYFFLLGLLAWFKNDFFSWTNSPSCNKCGRDTKFHSSDIPNDEERIWNCGNVECHQCFHCYTITRFPRYNHPQKLLETRTGRCGEWANCFTLCCRAVGFEARYVLDWEDHVWTEVYSDYHKRWLHCDSCENVCDKPLLYESGWNKKLTYVIAFSKDQIIDVTWRYSLLHMDVVNRRKLVPEEWLLDLSLKATKEFQSDIIEAERKSELLSRDIVEIVEFLTPRDTSKEEEQGRISGSLDWRKARGEAGGGETNDDDKKSYVFQATEENISKKRMRIRYFPAKDYYILNDSTIIHGWQNGVESSENMFRKVENDWKMVYLARHEGADTGTIKWSIDIQNTNLVISHVNVKIHSKLYQGAEIDFKLSSEVHSINFKDGADVSSDDFWGSKSLNLSAFLKGSTGNVAWQHAQLFRCADAEDKFVGLEFDILFSE